MSLYCEFRLCGEGGQGLMLMGSIVAHSLATNSNIHLLLNKSYGPETRGGACQSELIISDNEIMYPKVVNPDFVVALSKKAYSKYCTNLRKCTVLLDSNIIADNEAECRYIRFPFLETARNTYGNVQAANMIALGMLASVCEIIDGKQIMTDIEHRFFGHGYDSAFKLGYTAIEKGLTT